MLNLPNVNLWAVLISAAASFVIGMVWYSPWLFGKMWKETCCKTTDECDMKNCMGSMAISFLGSLLFSYVFALFIVAADATAAQGAVMGFWFWLGFMVTTHLSSVLWEKSPLNIYFIKMGNLLVTFLAVGAILGAWA